METRKAHRQDTKDAKKENAFALLGALGVLAMICCS
jgi:hypothetical protein